MRRTSRTLLFHLLRSALALPYAAWAQAAAPVPYRFENVAIVAGGFITGLVAHPGQRGLRYLRTDIGGAYRWDDAAKHWSALEDSLPIAERNLLGIESLAIDPSDAMKLYLAAGTYLNAHTPNGAILRSVDQGRHFEITRVPFKMGGNEEGRFAGERLQVDPNHGQTLLLGTRVDGLWRSLDSGVTWNRVRTFPGLPLNHVGLTFVAFDRSSGHAGQPTPVILVGVADPVINLLRSDDAGKTWKSVVGGPQGMFPNHGVFSSDGTLYLSYSDAPGPNGMGNGAVWAYAPRTGKWRDITPEKPGAGGEQRYHFNDPQASHDAAGFGYGIVTVDPSHPQTLLASTMDRWHPGDTIFRSTDGGAHWQSLAGGATRDASLAPYLRHLAAQPPFGHWIGAAMIDPFDSAHVLYGTGETIWESHDATGSAGTHWTVGAPGLEETADRVLLSPALPTDAGPHLFTGLRDIGCFRHDDFEHSPAGGAMKNPEFSNCDAIALAQQKPAEMVRVGQSWTSGPHGAVSHDGGLHWSAFASEPKGGERGGDAAISSDSRLLLWAVRNGPLAMSADGGAHWRQLSPAPSPGSGPDKDEREPLEVLADARGGFLVHDPAAGTLYGIAADGASHLVSKTAPKGGRLRVAASASTNLASPHPAFPALWIASDAGLFRSVDGGAQWKPLPGVARAYAVGFGKAAPGAGAPAIYLAGALIGTPEAGPAKPDEGLGGGLYRSTDDGATWQRIDDAEHRYASVEQITGDPRLFGRVSLGTTGRGVLWGDPGK